MSLAVPLSDPAVPLSETHVYVGCLRSADFANHAERKKNCADLRRLALSYRPTRGMWDCSLFAKPDNDPELARVDASGRDRPAVMTPE